MSVKLKFSSIIFNLLIIISSLIGLILSISGSDTMMVSFKSLLFFTLQSNIICIIVSILTLVFLIKNYISPNKKIPSLIYTIKFLGVCCITLTMLVFWLFLAIQTNVKYLLGPSNLTLHTISPILCILDFLLNDNIIKFNNSKIITCSCGFPIYYLIFVFICVYHGITFSNGKDGLFPYFFLNYRVLGWFKISKNGLGVFYWIIIMICITIGIGYGLYNLKIFVNNKFKEKISHEEFLK